MHKTDVLKAGLVQQSCTENREENIQKSISGIKELASQGATLVVLQELHTGVYFCQAEDVNRFDMAEQIPGPSTELFSKVARETGVVLVTSLFEKRAPGIYHNTAVVFEKDGSIAGKYRKMHIPDDPAYYEKFYFTPGDLGFQPISTSVGKLGLLICWDQWYPEAARLMALAGADILIYPTAIGWESSDSETEKQRQLDAWTISQRAHSIANGLPLISVNRTGYEVDFSGVTGGITFWGNSFVSGSQGEILVNAPHDKEANFLVDIDLKRSENVRRIWPFFRDRRIDAYEGLLKRFLVK
ncbi:MAG: carbon-nitrogen hydrolase [Bacteroidota bacterium]